jgi:hypothetical protein
MKNLFIEGTPKTPTIDFNASSGVLTISGRVIPEDSLALFEPLKKWLEEFSQLPARSTVLEMRCEYLNEDSKFWGLLFRSLTDIKSKGFEVKVRWYCEEDDSDMLEAGEDFEAFSHLPFEYIAETF